MLYTIEKSVSSSFEWAIDWPIRLRDSHVTTGFPKKKNFLYHFFEKFFLVGKKKFFEKFFFAVLDVSNDADSENRIFEVTKIFFCELRTSRYAHSTRRISQNISDFDHFLAPMGERGRKTPKSRNSDAPVRSYERFKYLWNSIDLPPGLFDVSRWEKNIKISKFSKSP